MTKEMCRAVGAIALLSTMGACWEAVDEPAGPLSHGGGARDGGAGAATPVACNVDVPSQVFAPSCGAGGCHGAQNAADGLDLVSPGVGARVAGKPAISGGLLADSAHPTESVLYQRLLGKNGPRMPQGAAPLDEHTTACVLSWIQTLGAQTNGTSGSTPSNPTTPSGGSTTPVDAGSDTGTVVTPTTRPTIRVGAGATAAYTDQNGQTWSADTGFTGGQVTINMPPIDVAQTTEDPLYNHERWGGDDAGNLTDFKYVFTLPDGAYTVTLKFAETYSGAMGVGMRRFDVAIGGTKMLTDFDIYAAAGPNAAIDKKLDVVVSGGTLTMDFLRGAALTPKVDAIAIEPR